MRKPSWGRRDFMRLTAQTASALPLSSNLFTQSSPEAEAPAPENFSVVRTFNGSYEGEALSRISFPMGGLGAGMICLDGIGTLSKFSLRNRPNLTAEPGVFAAVAIKGVTPIARVIEGPTPASKLEPKFPGGEWGDIPPCTWGLPRFSHATFEAKFPFATVRLTDRAAPLSVELTGWSPFTPGDADNSSLPVAAVDYKFVNRTGSTVEAVFSFNAPNFLATQSDENSEELAKAPDRIHAIPGGFVLFDPGARDRPWDECRCAVWVEEPSAKVNHAWFRGGRLDGFSMAWADVERAACYSRPPLPDSSSPGASVFVPFTLAPGESKLMTIYIAWYAAKSDLFDPKENYQQGEETLFTTPNGRYEPWYVSRFSDVGELAAFWRANHQRFREASSLFSRTFYDSTLPPEVLEAVSANLTILKSTTILRQKDGRLWGWEGSNDSVGSCYGSSTHVWSYAQSLAHLFPDLERSLRETELEVNQNEQGYQACRAALPIRAINNNLKPEDFSALEEAADGQLAGIMKVYREWRISGSTPWLQRLWPKVTVSLAHAIELWDPEHKGVVEEPHANTYDQIQWGPDSRCTSIYLGALQAAVLMGKALGQPVELYSRILQSGTERLEGDLFNGEYFFQRTQWRGLKKAYTPDPSDSPEDKALTHEEGPNFQYGNGCLSDGLLGEWLTHVCGLPSLVDKRKTQSHLLSVRRYNFREDLSRISNTMRSCFGCGSEGGLLICTWPKGGRPSLPLVYADEVWTGVEYQVASHLLHLGKLDEGLEIVRACRRRYDGRIRNPFAEVEAGHWYARAMSSYALLQSLSGARYDAIDKVLYLSPTLKGNFRCFLATATGFGTVGVKDGTPFLEVAWGRIPYQKLEYRPA